MGKDIRAISLFSGAGGLDIGAIHAGVHIVWANDAMKEACETYRLNIGNHIVCGDVNQHIEEIKRFSDIDLVIGGPPCQGFSVAGKMDAEDKRSQLVWTYAKIVSIVKPKAFIMENVKALAEISRWKNVREQLLKTFRKEGYAVNYVVLNASDFNVPQARERVFFVGFRDKNDMVPNLELMMEPYKASSPSVGEILKQMDKAGSGNNKGLCNAKITLAKKPVLRNSAYSGMLFNGMGRPLDLDGYSATLPASMGGNKTPIVDEKALYEGQKPWVEHYFELISSDSSNIGKFKVPTYLRRLTLQEAARLQTFPDSYVFSGPQSTAFTQIGNAVPCNLAEAVCKMVIDVISDKQKLIPIMSETENTTLVVDKNKATQILLDAVENSKEIKDELGAKIKKILTTDEAKAFRYILFTAILAKATDDRVDPLSLQKKDNVPGAYDART
ncbi:MAG: restriction endonuclease, SacI family, partial [Lachnospiraceae bacterium]|nr:restriction endonuclease, SacI family [Lachnospiraceae bacterium]